MKTNSLYFLRKIAQTNAFKALAMATVSTVTVTVLMTLSTQLVYPSHMSGSLKSYYCSNEIDQEVFKDKCKEIASKYFEETKVSMSKEVVLNYCLYSHQVKDLLALFSFDRTRMDFASFAIGKVRDPENFAICKESFVLSSNHIVIDNMIRDYETSLNK